MSITLASLWPSRSGRGHTGRLDQWLTAEDLRRAFEEGWTVGVFENDQRGNARAPTHRVVLLPPRDAAPREPGGGRHTSSVTEGRAAIAAHAPAQGVRRELERQGYAVDRVTVERAPKGGRVADELDDEIPF